MINILDEIIANKRKEVTSNQALFPIKLLEKSTYFDSKPVSMVEYLRRKDKVGIIAEFKRKSPSKGFINPHVAVERTSIGYMQSGASGLSILTDSQYFGGKNEDLKVARNFNFCPILRKDFIIDEYQIIEAKSIGADVILLIASILSPDQVKSFAKFAKSLGLEVLLEVHDEEEMQRSIDPNIEMIGVNNRDLKTFQTDVETSKRLTQKIPNDFLKVSESGIDSAQTIFELMQHGYEGFLIGEYFMKNSRPEKACAELVHQIKKLISY
jgi:indole-3-glycerol phosphate synthase